MNKKETAQNILPTTPATLKDFWANQSDFYDISNPELSPFRSKKDFYDELHQVNLRNELENRFHAAVVSGDTQRAVEYLKQYSRVLSSGSMTSYPTPLEPLRNFKLSVISMNAILRKEIERNHVPNIYINHHASRFSWLIETADSYENVGKIILQMIETYSYLSRHYSMAAYSLPVKNTLLYIESHLPEPLDVKTLAGQVSLTPNYLSSLFKKEVGMTITSYIVQKRIYQSCFLLKTTNMTISDVAFAVGIEDANYFTKVFKKFTLKTPIQYRKSGENFIPNSPESQNA